MEFLIEFILDLFIEGTKEVVPNKNIPRWVRRAVGVLAILIFLAVTVSLIVIGIKVATDMLWGGLFIAGVGSLLLILSIFQAIKIIKQLK